MYELREVIKKASKELSDVEIEPELTRPQEQFGDYSTNVALRLASQLNKKPREVAEQLTAKLQSPLIAKTEIAGPGFINFWLTDEALTELLDATPEQKMAGQEIVVEYSDPNPFKVLHVGHLYTSVVGDAIAKLFETAGASVHRVNFGGDVGLHVGKTIWAAIKKLGDEEPEKLNEVKNRAEWMAECYVVGNNAYEDDQAAKSEIEELNKKVYQVLEQNDKDSALARIYWTCRAWSYEYFDEFYARIGTHFEKYYFESETVEPGMKAVKENINKVFEESDGAIVFKGEVHNLHTRVFINSQGLPTYETKDIGLMLLKDQDYHFDKSIIITGNEQYEYMQVVQKAAEQMMPGLVKKTVHLTHGMVRLPGSEKMSSRRGNIIRAEDALEAAAAANREINRQENADTALGAVKYAFLKNRIGADIIFDPAESVSLQGNSGPYLQYALVRANSILQKLKNKSGKSQVQKFEPGERSLARKISEYPEIIEAATDQLMPHHVATYLYELAQIFNRFYEDNRVVGDPREAVRVKLVKSYANVLKNGLEVLNIPAPERM